jgi:ABC-type glycerol-3-phosphate transport system substrate-binding protein
MNRRIALTAATIAITTSAIGLGISRAQTPALELWTWNAGSKRFYEEMAPKCNVNIKVTQTAIVQHHDRLRISLQSGGVGAPDLAEVEQGRFGAFIRGGGDPGLLDLAPWFKELGAANDLSEARTQLFTWNKKSYGLPIDLTPVVLYYRADIWEKAGVDPNSFETWTDYIAGAKKVVAANPGSVAMPLFPFLQQALLRQRGSDLFDANGTLLADSPASIEIWNWMTDLAKQGLAAPILGPLHVPNQPEDYAQYRNGKWLSVVGADWYAGFLRDNVPELAGKWRAALLPAWSKGGRRTTTLGGAALTIPKSGQNVEAAKKFAQCALLSNEGSFSLYRLTGSFPTRKSVWKDARLQVPEPYFGNQKLGVIFAEYAARIPRQFQSPYRSITQEKILAAYRGVLSGDVPAATMLKKVAADVREEMRRDKR